MEGTPFGRYMLLALLGRGGMGEVWRAYDTATDRIVAIKVLPNHLTEDPTFEQRFRREAQAAARLNSPHVIPIHNYGEIDGRLYVDMRLIEGRDLHAALADGPMEPERAVDIIEQVAEGLHAAHAIGLIHRDVKPPNIVLDHNDFAYLIDFGIARSADDTRMTGAGNAIGSLQYIAPERLGENAQEDARVDVYSLACVLYECLTGRLPFAGTSIASLVAAHLNTDPPQPSRTRPGVPWQFDSVIANGMAKNPDERFSTTLELADAARDALGVPGQGRTLMASPVPSEEDHLFPVEPRTDPPPPPIYRPPPLPPPPKAPRSLTRGFAWVAAGVAVLLVGAFVVVYQLSKQSPQVTNDGERCSTTTESQRTVLRVPLRPLWPFACQQEADEWLQNKSTDGASSWHADPVRTAQRFTQEFLGFTEIDKAKIDTALTSKTPDRETWVKVGYTLPNGKLAKSASIHLARFGTAPKAPWEVVGTEDDQLTLDEPAYGTKVGPKIQAGGKITGVDEGLHLQVRQSTKPGVLGDYCCLSAGGEKTPWTAQVPVAGAQPGVALTLVVWTGGHVANVEVFAITGLRPA